MGDLRIVVGDDEPLMREAIRLGVDGDSAMTVVGEATTGAELIDVVRRVEPDLVLLDLAMPPLDGFECIERLRAEHPDVIVVLLSACDDRRQIEGALRRGASAFLLKVIDPLDLPSLIRQIVEQSAFVMPVADRSDPEENWRSALSERELTVLAYVAEGLTNKEIAARLWLSEQTIKFHVRNVYRKLGISSRTDALRFAHEHDAVTVAA